MTRKPWSGKPASSSSAAANTCTAIRSPYLQAFGTKHLSKLEREKLAFKAAEEAALASGGSSAAASRRSTAEGGPSLDQVGVGWCGWLRAGSCGWRLM